MRSLLLAGAALAALGSPLAAVQDGARDVVQTAERAYADDSAAAVTSGWVAALRRDSTDRAAAAKSYVRRARVASPRAAARSVESRRSAATQPVVTAAALSSA